MVIKGSKEYLRTAYNTYLQWQQKYPLVHNVPPLALCGEKDFITIEIKTLLSAAYRLFQRENDPSSIDCTTFDQILRNCEIIFRQQISPTQLRLQAVSLPQNTIPLYRFAYAPNTTSQLNFELIKKK